MYLRVLFFLFFPACAFADGQMCLTLSPRDNPAETVAACTDFLLDEALETPLRADALVARGVAFRNLGELERSVDDLEASIVLQEDTSAMRMLAWTYREMARYEKAEALYTRVLAEDPHWQGWLSRCVVRQDLDKYEAALEDCREALGRDEDNLDVLYFTARAYSFLDRPGEALPLTTSAVALAPDDPRHLVEHVWALYQLGRTRVSRKLAQDGLERFPGNAGLERFLEETR